MLSIFMSILNFIRNPSTDMIKFLNAIPIDKSTLTTQY
jgi:hypothetical protein